MKRIKFMLLAIAMLLAAPAFFTSCQEDAPEINYTMNVSVINDFTKVVEAINNGALKNNEEAIKKLTEAIDRMNTDQQTKLQAVIDVLTSVNARLETKLAAIEGTIKAQTLSLEAKLKLLEAAIKALPDYTAQLEAIKTAIANLPDYSEKFDAVVAALNAMKTQVEVLGTGQTDIATKIAEATTAINSLIAAVNSGNTIAAAALAQIVAKLEELKEAIGGSTTPSTMEFVDLGLPSGLKWAKCNLGASKPSDSGDYYAWGETQPNKAVYSWATYKWGTEGNSTKYNATDGKNTLDPEDDVATSALGSPWRMPTSDDIHELSDNCTWTWTTQDGVNGYEVKGRNGNTIFLPAAGRRVQTDFDDVGRWGLYWSKECNTSNNTDRAYFLHISSNYYRCFFDSRFVGYQIRPVRP